MVPALQSIERCESLGRVLQGWQDRTGTYTADDVALGVASLINACIADAAAIKKAAKPARKRKAK